jgi:uncharacterized protein YndB with AHSA1/START domain
MAATDTFRVERSTTIGAPPDAVFPLVEDFHRWTDWSPFEKLDAKLDKTYSGAPYGKGAVYAWAGKKAGAGRMEITACEPASRIVIQLDFTKPFAAHNTAEFTFEPKGKGARVTWAMTGPHTVMSKLMGVFFSMDKMVGPQFEEGLANLKRLVEAQTATA